MPGPDPRKARLMQGPKGEVGKMSPQEKKKKKKKLLTAEEFFKIKDSDQKFTGPKSTKGSLGDTINQFREMDDKIISSLKMAKGGRAGLKGGGMDMGSPKNRAIQNLKEFLKNRKKSKIPKNNLNRDRSPMEVNRVISKMKSDAQAMGGDFKTASELKPLKGESRKSFESRPSTKFFNKGGRVGLKSGSKGCKLAMKGKGRAYGKNS